MSVQATHIVWECSRQKGTALLVLLAIADHVRDAGLVAWPSAATLARMCRTSERNVRKILPDLVAVGEITPAGTGVRGVVKYRLTMGVPPEPQDRGQGGAGASTPELQDRGEDDATPEPQFLGGAPTPELEFTPEPGFTPEPQFRDPCTGVPRPLNPSSPDPYMNRIGTGDGGTARAITPACAREATPDTDEGGTDLPAPEPNASRTSPEWAPVPATAGPRAETDARTLAQAFVRLRSQHWPEASSLPAPMTTLTTEAQQFLDAGAPVALILDLLERSMSSAAGRGMTPTRSFRAIADRVQDALAATRAPTLAGGPRHDQSGGPRPHAEAGNPVVAAYRTLYAPGEDGP